MFTPSEYKTVKICILEYAQDIHWTIVPLAEAEQRSGFDPDASSKECSKGTLFFFDDLIDVKVWKFDLLYAEPKSAPINQFRHLYTNVYGNREFIDYLRNRLLQRQNATASCLIPANEPCLTI